jgi:hypothetical protein
MKLNIPTRIAELVEPNLPQVAPDSRVVHVDEHAADEPWQQLKGGVYLGSDEFARTHAIDDDLELELPAPQKRPTRPTLSEIFRAHGEQAIAVAHHDHGYRLAEIAALLGVHYATVSRRLTRLQDRPSRRSK